MVMQDGRGENEERVCGCLRERGWGLYRCSGCGEVQWEPFLAPANCHNLYHISTLFNCTKERKSSIYLSLSETIQS